VCGVTGTENATPSSAAASTASPIQVRTVRSVICQIRAREGLYKYRQWAIASGVAESMREKYERHQLKMARLGISLDNHHSLKNRLNKIKRWVVSPELRSEKQRVMSDVETALAAHTPKVKRIRPDNARAARYRNAWWRWVASAQCTVVTQMQLEGSLKSEFPTLLATDSEKYYRMLLERAGVPLS